MVTAKITSKGQLTLPKQIRKLLDVHTGSVVVFEREDEKIVIKSAKTLRGFKGALRGIGEKIDFDEMRKKAKEYVGKKAAHGR